MQKTKNIKKYIKFFKKIFKKEYKCYKMEKKVKFIFFKIILRNIEVISLLDICIGMLIIGAPLLIFLGKATTLILYGLFGISIIYISKKNSILEWILYLIVSILIILNIFKAINLMEIYPGILKLQLILTYAMAMVSLFGIFKMCQDNELVKKLLIYIKKYKLVFLGEIVLSQLVIIYYLVSGKGFNIYEEINIFTGTYVEPHPFGYALIIMIILLEILKKFEKNENIRMLLNIFYVIPIVAVFLTGARSVAIAFVLLLLGLLLRERSNKNGKSIVFIIGISFMLILFTLNITTIANFISESMFMDRFTQTISNGNVTSGRNVFWSQLLNSYINEMSMLTKLIGNGIFSTIILNSINYGMKIWAHSDIIDILISYGLIMLIIVAFQYINYFKNLIRMNGIFIASFIILGILFLITTNGIINYPFFLVVFMYINLLFCKEREIKEVRMEDECINLS